MRRQLAVAAVLLALPLLAFPLVSPPPNPPDQLVHGVHDYRGPDDLDEVEGARTYHYEDLSERGKAIFEAAHEDGTHAVAVGTGVPEFDYADYEVTLVEYRGEVYRFGYDRHYTGPTLRSTLLRLGSLVGAVVLGAAGGYVLVNADE